MKYILLILATSCIGLSEGDLNKARDKCQEVVENEIPNIVQQVTDSVLPFCAQINDNINGATTVVIEGILTRLGCTKADGDSTWSCVNSTMCHPVGDAE